jgi:hypothetical protein
MANVTDFFEPSGDDFVLHVHVQPGAGRSAVVGRHGNALKVRVAAPPVGGRANSATEELLATALGVKPAEIELASGEASRAKRFRVKGLDAEEFERRLRVALDAAGRTPSRPTHAT